MTNPSILSEQFSRKIDLVFTLGRKDVYENLEPGAKKAKGGSVWQTRLEAEEWKEKRHLPDFNVYEVEANWDTDVEDDEEFGTLKHDAPII